MRAPCEESAEVDSNRITHKACWTRSIERSRKPGVRQRILANPQGDGRDSLEI
jgi:hypothetical protein